MIPLVSTHQYLSFDMQKSYVRLRAKMGRIKIFRKAGYIFEENNNDIYLFKVQE